MKSAHSFLLIAFALILTSQYGCKPMEKLIYNNLRANVNSANFSTTAITGTTVAGRITLAGSTPNGSQMMTLIIPAGIAPGTFKLTSTGNYLIEYKAGNNSVYAASSGELVIESHDMQNKRIKGNFNFKGLNINSAAVDVRDGSFIVSYF